LTAEAERRGIRAPTPATLRRYGLTADKWLRLLKTQGWCCPICRRGSGVIWNTDHEHVSGWKALPPKERAKFVRGVLCAGCNYQAVDSRMSAATSQRVTDYLRAYEKRRDA
jgi:hypothetical protein